MAAEAERAGERAERESGESFRLRYLLNLWEDAKRQLACSCINLLHTRLLSSLSLSLSFYLALIDYTDNATVKFMCMPPGGVVG